MALKKSLVKKPPLPPKNIDDFTASLQERVKESIKIVNDIDTDEFQGSLPSHIVINVFKPCDYLKNRRNKEYNDEDYRVGFECFMQILEKLNKVVSFTPTPITFAQFMGITKQTFKLHAEEQTDRGAEARRIWDILTEIHTQNMYANAINPVVGIFTGKALLGLRDNENPNINIMNVTTTQKSVDDIINDYKNITVSDK